jgi:hypothetical protein
MMPAEDNDGEWAGVDRAAWGETEHATPGDPIHACVDFVVMLVIVVSAVGCLASAIGVW